MTSKKKAIILAFLAAVFYAVNTPFSKMLLENVPSTFMAGLLYIGSGIVGCFSDGKNTADVV